MNKELKKPNIIELAMKYRQVTFAIFGLFLAFGLYSVLNMQRSEDPRIDIKQAVIYSLYPGANVQQVEEQVTQKLEEFLFGYEEIDKEDTYSVTREGRSVITIDLQDHIDVDELETVWSKIRGGLNTYRMNLPNGLIGPILNSDFGETTAIIVSLSSERHSYAVKKDFLKILEDEIKVLPKASKINRLGLQTEQITVTTNTEKMSRYGLNIQQVAGAIRQANTIKGTGELSSASFNVPINTNSLYESITQLENQIVNYEPNGNIVRLKDIANIERGYADLEQKIVKNNENVLALSVEMQPGFNIVDFGHDLDVAIENARDRIPEDVKIEMIHSQPEIVDEAVNHFFVEFAIAVAAVIVVIMILLPLRMATVSAIASPVSILITFAVLNLLGLAIHSVTLAGMIICLGMVVDDAVIIVDNYIEKLDEGMDRWQAAWQSATQLFVPILTATAAIIFAFLPLSFLMTGITSDFIFVMPITVSLALGMSFVVAIFLTPYLCFLFIKKGVHNKAETPENKKPSVLDKVQGAYDKSIEWVFRNGKLAMGTGFVVVLIGVFMFSKVPQEFFPKLERDIFNLEVWLPEGASVEKTEMAVSQIVKDIEEDKRIKSVSSFIGESSPRFHSTYAPEPPAENYAQLFIKAYDAHKADEALHDYITSLATKYPEATVRVRQLSYQEAPTPLEIRVIGTDIDDLQAVADKVEGVLQKVEGVNWLHTDWREEYYRMGVEINTVEANRLGLTSSGISEYIGGLVNGFPVSTYWEEDEPINISVRLEETYRQNFDDLGNTYIPTISGKSVPLRQVASFEPEWMPGRIVRRNGLRTITVRSEAQLGRFASEILADAIPQIEKLDLPEGVRIGYGGDQEATEENMPSLITSLAASVLLIFLTLMFQFKDVRKSLIILSTFVLAIPGAAIGLLALNHPFGFTAFLGTISLIGIVVRNGIILVDYADELVRDHGYGFREAALLAAQRRMRPIFLTASAAAIGVVPMIVGGSSLWAPLASVLCIGLMWSMFMTLYIIPLMYNLWLGPKSSDSNSPITLSSELAV